MVEGSLSSPVIRHSFVCGGSAVHAQLRGVGAGVGGHGVEHVGDLEGDALQGGACDVRGGGAAGDGPVRVVTRARCQGQLLAGALCLAPLHPHDRIVGVLTASAGRYREAATRHAAASSRW